MTLREKLHQCRDNRSALLATNFYNFETLKGILEAAKASASPVILQLTRSSIDYMGLENALNMGRTGLKSYGVEGWVHLDHGDSLDLVKRCLEAGFDSVMIDGSELPLEENIDLTSQAVKLAKSFGANVEAELGYIAKLGQSTERMESTDPAEACRFVEVTGVDALAVAIGTAHGFYREEPRLDFRTLSALRDAVPVPLVMHGSSGVPDEDVKKAVRLGITKVNLATEVKNMFAKSLKGLMAGSDEIDIRKVFPPAIEAVSGLVARKMALMGG